MWYVLLDIVIYFLYVKSREEVTFRYHKYTDNFRFVLTFSVSEFGELRFL